MTDPSPVAGHAELLSTAVGTWTLDPSATTIELHTKAMWGLAKVTGHFTAVEGSAVVGSDGSVSGTLVIDAASVNTGTAKRDEHLRTKDFFEVDTYPTFAYEVSAVTPAADGTFAVSGTFTVHGQTRPLDLVATAVFAEPDRATVTATADIDRTQWGLNWTKMGARVDNHVIITAVFTKK
jgi:polyisoprenoid-binding protein YceI